MTNRRRSRRTYASNILRPLMNLIVTVAALLVGSIADNAGEAQEISGEAGRTTYRRLNRTEYENTICDLLGIDTELRELLPADSSAAGFDNVGDGLRVSSFLLERYLETADRALDIAISNSPRPALRKQRFSLKEERLVKTTTESVYRLREDSVVMFSSSAWNAVTVGQFYPPDRGRYRVRISSSGFQSDDRPVTFRIDAGPMLMGTKNHLVGYFDAPADQSVVVEFEETFEPRHHFRISPYGLANAQQVSKIGADQYSGPGLCIDWIEVEGPLHDSWPPESHRRIFGDLPQEAAPVFNNSTRVEVASNEPQEDAVRILRDFAQRAFRRPVTEQDVSPFINLTKQKLSEGRSFEQAVRVGLTAILVSPEFLFLREQPGKLDEYALANRLSYFLWSTMPDEELLRAASAEDPSQHLSNTAILRQQTDRLLADSRARSFTENFLGQWLSLRDIDFTEPSHQLHPEYDDLLKVSMVREAELFFDQLLKDNLSLTHIVASDFSMLNARLAKHYGIPDVDGFEFRKMPLPADVHRGGFLTMAAVLKVTANGTSTSPVTRGAWVLDRILGQPPSPPPENVSALEPDIRGATTIREQLAKHRQIDSCASCHMDIDPPGFALENFDVIGGWREHYRTTTWAKHVQEVTIDGRKMPYYHGLRIDASDTLSDGRSFQNIDELKQLLLEDKDLLARAFAARLIVYATGAAVQPDDEREIARIVDQIRPSNYGVRSLIHEIVQSPLFQEK